MAYLVHTKQLAGIRMISEESLRTLLSDLESDRVERTESVNNTEKFSQAVCAFANDLPGHDEPGYLIIGVSDDGKPVGANITDEVLRNLGGLRSDGNIQPLPRINLKKFDIDGSEVAVVEVFPSHYTPVRYKGSVCVRVGPRKAVASEQEERTLIEKRVSSARSFDASAANGSDINDISLSLFTAYRRSVVSADVIEANHRSIENQLASLRFFDTKLDCPTHAGILLFGKDTRFYLPGAYIQYLKLDGDKLTDPVIDQAEISGDLLSVLRELDTRVKSQIHTTLQTVSILREQMIYDFPERAVRELLLNSVMHRDYQSNAPIKFYWFRNRIEIQNPGGLYGGVTIKTIETSNDYRNPVIAEAMKALGYVNRYGYGIQNAQKSLSDNGSPRAEFQSEGNIFLAIIRRRDG